MNQPANASTKKHVLIIEDEISFREMLTKELTKEGFKVSSAVDGVEGLEKVRKEHPDLVLLDIVMPRKDGFAVMEEMHADEVLRTIPVIVLSNSGDIVELKRAKDFGAKEILIKTAFGPQELSGKVQAVFSGSSPQPAETKPQAPAPPAPSSPATPQEKSEPSTPDGSPHVLLVEDDPFLWSLIRSKLVKEGFRATVAQNGEKGLEQAQQVKPDLILLDIILPDMNGFSVLESLKADKSTASIPVVVLSNLGQQEDISKAKTLGAVDYLIKAHHAPQEIVDKIRTILGKSKS